jgi:IPT/TIG domain
MGRHGRLYLLARPSCRLRSATDLKNAGTGSLTVDNPGLNSTTSGNAPLVTTDQAFPTITDVSVSVNSTFSPCAQLLITVTGKNFDSSSTLQVNGMALQPINYVGDTSSIINYLPAGLVAKPGTLSVTVTNPWSPPLVSAPFIYPATSPTVLAICAIPSPTTVYPKSNFTVTVQPTEVNATGSEQLSVGSLPSGLSVSKSAIALPATGAVLHFQAAAFNDGRSRNLKYLFPGGAQLFSPRVFTYSAFPEYAIMSGGSPDGGEPGTISGYGLPTDPSNGSLTVGGNSATITTKTSQYLPFTQEPFPSTYLNFIVPPGTPGFRTSR